jgi:peptidoglycan/LPS O-acetylase OafA/YrhL
LRATTGEHWLALDHVRALAAFLVFCWHFLHWTNGYPVPFGSAPVVFPLALADEGHVGVALFMTLSGYLFAKLLIGRQMRLGGFLWNRFLRLAPLLFVTIVLVGVQQTRGGGDPWHYVATMLTGFVLPVWPNGGWSIAVEMQFYLLLPILLALRKRPWAFALLITTTIALRAGCWALAGEAKSVSYFTIFGRLDQFAAGIMMEQVSRKVRGRHLSAVIVATAFAAFYWLFDRAGGADGLESARLWIVLPTIEAGAFSFLIAYYDSTFKPKASGLSWLIGKLGEYSYSTYLLHFFVLERLVKAERQLGWTPNFYIALAAAIVAFVAMLPIGYLSYRFIEAPPLRFRKRYLEQGK